jgi:hypothetical protein
MADYLSCSACEISFEVENGGRYIRLKHIPDSLEFVDGVLSRRWVEASKLAGVIASRRPAAPQKAASSLSASSLTNEEAWNRALKMYRLGNSPKMIQLMLLQSGQTQQQADAIFLRLKKVAEEDALQQSKKFWTVAGVSMAVITLLAFAWLAASGRLAVMAGIATATPEPTQLLNQPSAIGMLLKLIPAGSRPDLMNLPETTVEENKGPAPAACPATPETAASLFGGDPAFWMRDMNQFPSWQMINPADSITVKVPKGMTAGYLDNKSFQALSARGPATIHNVNFVVITCD